VRRTKNLDGFLEFLNIFLNFYNLKIRSAIFIFKIYQEFLRIFFKYLTKKKVKSLSILAK
jgi:hypothetical protein